jgi:hypothetical protein
VSIHEEACIRRKRHDDGEMHSARVGQLTHETGDVQYQSRRVARRSDR